MADFASVVVNAMLGGELLSCSMSVLLTWLEQHTSYSDHAVTCHVSGIQKDPRLSLRNLPRYSDHLWSHGCNEGQVYACGWASVVEQRLECVSLMMWISEEFVLSGIHMCAFAVEGNVVFLRETTWILGSAWETLALSLAVWIAIKHFRELQQTSTGWAVEDCFTILMQTHILYFARWGRNLNIVIFPAHTRGTLVFLLFLALTSSFSSRASWYATHDWLVYIRPFLIDFIELNFDWRWNLFWYYSNCPIRADVCAGTTAHP